MLSAMKKQNRQADPEDPFERDLELCKRIYERLQGEGKLRQVLDDFEKARSNQTDA